MSADDWFILALLFGPLLLFGSPPAEPAAPSLWELRYRAEIGQAVYGDWRCGFPDCRAASMLEAYREEHGAGAPPGY